MADLCREHGISPKTYYKWKVQYGSPAIGHGDCTGNSTAVPNAPAVTTDETGSPRLNPCDIGAYESDLMSNTATPTPTNTATSTLTPTASVTLTPSSTPTLLPGSLDTIGIYRSGTFYLRNENSSGSAEISVAFNPSGTNLPVVGDWTGSHYDTVGVYNQVNGVFTLCILNDNTGCGQTANQINLVFGNPNDTPLAGRWMSSAAHAGVGIFRPSNGIIYLRNELTTGYSEYSEVLGNPGDDGVAGDWTGKGYDSAGVYRPTASTFYLSNVNVTSGVIYADLTAIFGNPESSLPIIGDWIGQGHDGIGLFLNGNVYLRNAVSSGAADNTFLYGASGDLPIAGHWLKPVPTATPTLTATASITLTPSNTATNTPCISPTPGPVPNGGVNSAVCKVNFVPTATPTPFQSCPWYGTPSPVSGSPNTCTYHYDRDQALNSTTGVAKRVKAGATKLGYDDSGNGQRRCVWRVASATSADEKRGLGLGAENKY